MPILTQSKQSLVKHVMVYGPSKTGKSELVSKLAYKHKLLWFDLENGSDVLFKLPPEAQANITLIKIPDSRSNPVAVDTMLKVAKGGKGEICFEHGRFRCPLCMKLPNYAEVSDLIDIPELKRTNNAILVVDSLTQYVASATAHINKGQPDDRKFEFDDWAKLGALGDAFLSEIQAAPYDAVIISHEDMVETVDGKDKIVPVSGTRNKSRNTAKWFSDVIYANVNNKKHSFYSSTTYHNLIQTGSRSDLKLESMEVPSLLPLFEHRITNQAN